MKVKEFKELSASIKANLHGYDEDCIYRVTVVPEDDAAWFEFIFKSFELYSRFIGHIMIHSPESFGSVLRINK